MSNENIEYDDYYVAFLDILGFKEIIKTKTCEEIYSVFNFIKKDIRAYFSVNCEDISAFDDVKYKIISDSIVVYIKSSIDNAFFALLYTCQKLQVNLLCQETPVLLRGGISKGSLFVQDDIIYGESLTNAYIIENSVAIYPRIVFEKSLLDEGIKNCKKISPTINKLNSLFYLRESDELFFINFMPFSLFADINTTFDFVDNILKGCQEYINSDYDLSIRSKYMWLKHIAQILVKGEKDFLINYSKWKDYFSRNV